MAKKKQTKEKKVSYEEIKEKKKTTPQKDTETSSKTRVSRNRKLYTQDQTSTSLKIQVPEEEKKEKINKTNQNTSKEKDKYKKNIKDKENKDIKEYNEKDKYQHPIEESKNLSRQGLILIIIVLIFTIAVLVGIDIYHFITFNHHEVKTVTKIKEKKVVDDNIVFLGDSITEYYDLPKFYGEDLPIINSGINGNKTKDIINNMKERVYDYNPSKVFILIGTNDFLEKTATTDQICKNIKEIIELIKKNRPYAKIYLESIYPINDTDDKKVNHKMVNNRTNKKISQINTELKEYAKENDITYIDMYEKLIDEDGNLDLDYTNEGLHLSEKGYEVVTEELEKYVKE